MPPGQGLPGPGRCSRWRVMSAAQGWDRNRRRGGGAAGSGGGGGGSGASGGSGGSGGRGTGQLNRFVQLSGRPHLPGESGDEVLTAFGCGGRVTATFSFLPGFLFCGEEERQAPRVIEGQGLREKERCF